YYKLHNYKISNGINSNIFQKLYYFQNKGLSGKVDYIFSNDSFQGFSCFPRKKAIMTEYGLLADINVIKLHLTLSWDDFIKHREPIMEILFNSIIDGTIAEFKHINEEYKKQGGKERYVNGDQFTIYFPTEDDPDFDIEKIVNLCSQLNNYC